MTAGPLSPVKPGRPSFPFTLPSCLLTTSRNNDEGLVAQLYNPSLKAWFGDKGDGVRTGEPSDPRMTVLEVKIDEVRHFHQTKTSIGTAVDVVASAITGSVATPGEVRTITGQEIAQAWAKGELTEP